MSQTQSCFQRPIVVVANLFCFTIGSAEGSLAPGMVLIMVLVANLFVSH